MRRLIFDSDHRDFREMVRGFLEEHAVPHTDAWEEAGMVDRGFWKRAAAQGLVAFAAPESLGGAGIGDFRFNAVIDEELVYTGTAGDGFPLVNDIVAPYLLDLATPEQQRRWLPGVTSGAIVPAIAISEPGAGSDMRAIATKARWDGKDYVVSGSKTFVTSGCQAEIVIVATQIERDGDRRLGLLVLEAEMPGFERGRKLKKVGRRAQDTGELFFDDVVVPPENVLGDPARGLAHLMRNLPQERLSIAVMAAASAERALDLTLEYGRERVAFGQSVASFQANRFALAELATEVALGRAYVDRCIQAHVAGELTDVEAAGVKYWTTELQFRVIDYGVQLHGGYGYMEEYEIARMWRDARVQRIYGGTNEIMKEIVSRSLEI